MARHLPVGEANKMYLEQILRELRLDRLSLRNLPDIEVEKTFIKKTIEEFLETYHKIKDEIKVPSNTKYLYRNIIELWRTYMENLYLMDNFVEKYHPIYPRKLKIVSEFAKLHYLLNIVTYHYTTHEKPTIEKIKDYHRVAETVTSPYALFKNVKDVEFELLPLTEEGYILYTILLKNRTLVERYQKTILEQRSYELNLNENFKERYIFEDEDIYDISAYKLLLLDNIIELTWRESGLLLTDVAFYYSIGRFHNKTSALETISHLHKLSAEKEEKFKFTIPRFRQSYNSCGVVCMMNVLKTYIPQLTLSKKLEKEILGKVTIQEYPGNLTPLLVKVAKEDYGIDSYMFIDYDHYIGKIKGLMEKYEDVKKAAEVFLNELHNIKYEDREKFTFDEVVELLKQGHMISYVGEVGGFRHYRLIFGYDIGERELMVYDPMGYDFRLPEERMVEEMRNKLSFWGIVYKPKDAQLLDAIEKQIGKIKKVLEGKVNLETIKQII